MFKVVGSMVLALALAGCVTQQRYQPTTSSVHISSPQKCPFRTGVKVEDSNFEPVASILGVEMLVANYIGYNCGESRALVRSFIDKKSGVTTHQLYVSMYYKSDWRFYNRATNERGEAVEFLEINRDVVTCASSPCLLSEVFGIKISEKELRTAQGPIKFQASSKSGHKQIITVTQGAIMQQIEAVDKYKLENKLK